jgi:hypothetical protein
MAMRVPVFRPVLVLAAAVVLCATGCLDFEKQTFIITFQPERDEINVLLLYEGLQVGGKQAQDLKNAEKAFKAVFAEGKGLYLGHPIAAVSLAPDKDKKPSEKEQKVYDLLTKHLTVRKGTFFLDKNGSLCGSQEITIRQAKAFVRGINDMISAEVGSMADKALGDATKKQTGFYDEETLKLMRKAVKDKHQWIHFEPGRISVTLVGSQKYFANVKHSLSDDLLLRDLRRMVGMPHRPGQPAPRPVDPAELQKILRHKFKEAERFTEVASATPWSLDQRRHRATFSLGLGEGEPLHFFSPYVSTEQGNQAAALVAHAKTLGLEIKKDATAKSVIADFLRRHGSKKKE